MDYKVLSENSGQNVVVINIIYMVIYCIYVSHLTPDVIT